MRGLRREFGQTVAVDHLDLNIQRGEIFGLIGPDGSGKTTILRMLAAILRPTQGSATVNGFDVVREADPIKEHIGYMAQLFSLYRDLSILENLTFFADMFNVPRQVRDERIERLLGFARLTEFRHRRAGQLSGGMQKKLGLACTLIHQPDILYLDEPTTGVDPVSRREFWDILTELHLQGVTIVISTPYMDEAERCSRIGLMHNGHLIQCDTPAAIKKLIPGKVLQVKPSDRFGAYETLITAEGVLDVQTYGEMLHVFVSDLKQGQQVIEQNLKQAKITHSGMRQVEPRVEEAFIWLIRQEKGAALP
jgi:ABC-2 type transport system ATP-binding protein